MVQFTSLFFFARRQIHESGVKELGVFFLTATFDIKPQVEIP